MSQGPTAVSLARFKLLLFTASTDGLRVLVAGQSESSSLGVDFGLIRRPDEAAATPLTFAEKVFTALRCIALSDALALLVMLVSCGLRMWGPSRIAPYHSTRSAAGAIGAFTFDFALATCFMVGSQNLTPCAIAGPELRVASQTFVTSSIIDVV